MTSKFTALKDLAVAPIPEILQRAEVLTPKREPQVSRDTKDNKFLAAVEASNTNYLVSEDRDLLYLTEHEGTHSVTAIEFLQALKQRRQAA